MFASRRNVQTYVTFPPARRVVSARGYTRDHFSERNKSTIPASSAKNYASPAASKRPITLYLLLNELRYIVHLYYVTRNIIPLSIGYIQNIYRAYTCLYLCLRSHVSHLYTT